MAEVTPIRRNVAIVLIGLVATINYVDRQAFSVLMQGIKKDMVLSDTMLGLIGGLIFGLLYALCSLPIARLADRHHRPLIISVSLAAWSLATAACGLAMNAWQLALARMAVAVGESGSAPASMALLTDIVRPERRTLAIGYFQAANSVGLSLGIVLAAWLASMFTWRETFLIVGLPGVVIALIFMLLVVEPRKADEVKQNPPPPLGDAVRVMLKTPTLRWIGIMCLTIPMPGFGFLMWTPAFMERSHGFATSETGWVGVAILLGLVTGNLASGWLGDRYGSANPKMKAWLSAGTLFASVPFALGICFAPTAFLSLASFVAFKFIFCFWLPLVYSLAFVLVPPTMRALISSVIGLLVILAGVGFGNFAIGAISDFFTARFGEESLRYALASMTLGIVLGGLAGVMAALRFDGDKASYLRTEAQASAA